MSPKKIYRCNRQQNVLWLRAAVGRDGDKSIKSNLYFFYIRDRACYRIGVINSLEIKII